MTTRSSCLLWTGADTILAAIRRYVFMRTDARSFSMTFLRFRKHSAN